MGTQIPVYIAISLWFTPQIFRKSNQKKLDNRIANSEYMKKNSLRNVFFCIGDEELILFINLK